VIPIGVGVADSVDLSRTCFSFTSYTPTTTDAEKRTDRVYRNTCHCSSVRYLFVHGLAVLQSLGNGREAKQRRPCVPPAPSHSVRALALGLDMIIIFPLLPTIRACLTRNYRRLPGGDVGRMRRLSTATAPSPREKQKRFPPALPLSLPMRRGDIQCQPLRLPLDITHKHAYAARLAPHLH
jgi:hypothetical protein